MVAFFIYLKNPWQFYHIMVLLKYRKGEENRILDQGYIVKSLTRNI